ncbi:hypothetical protein ACFRFU_38140 [Streptomyces sp. NPDC056704]
MRSTAQLDAIEQAGKGGTTTTTVVNASFLTWLDGQRQTARHTSNASAA